MRAPSPEGPQPRSASRPLSVRLSAARERSLIRDRCSQRRRHQGQAALEPVPTRGDGSWLRPGACFPAGRHSAHRNPRSSGAWRRGRERRGAGLGWAGRRHRMRRKPGACRLCEEPAASHAARRPHGAVSGRRGYGCCPHGGEGAGGAAGPGGRCGHGAALPAAGARSRGGGGRRRAPRLRLLPGFALAALLQSTR